MSSTTYPNDGDDDDLPIESQHDANRKEPGRFCCFHDGSSSQHLVNDEPSSSMLSTIPNLLRDAMHSPDQLTAMVSNYSTSFNVVNIGVVLPIIKYSLSHTDHVSSSEQDIASVTLWNAVVSMAFTVFDRLLQIFECFSLNSIYSISEIQHSVEKTRLLEATNQNNQQDSIVASSILVGMILGQIIGGFLGDYLGRRNAMLLMMLMQIGGSLGGALFIGTNSDNRERSAVFKDLALWRFILGIGAGGVYPLAAVMSAENQRDMAGNTEMITSNIKAREDSEAGISPEQERNEKRCTVEYVPTSSSDDNLNDPDREITIKSSQRVALTFSMQGLGFLTVPLLAYPMLALQWNTDIIWRLLLGFGALPGFCVLYLVECAAPGDRADSINEHLLTIEENTNPTTHHGIQKPNEETLETGKVTSDESSGTLSDEDISTCLSVSPLFDGAKDDKFIMSTAERDIKLLSLENSDLESESSYNNVLNDEIDASHIHSPSVWSFIKREPNLARKFAGTAGTWFLFDVLFYGNTLFAPLVFESAFSAKIDASDEYSLLLTVIRDSLVISLLSLPGYILSILLIGRRTCDCHRFHSQSTSYRLRKLMCLTCNQTPVFIQMQGFFLMFLLYLVIGMYWASLSNLPWLLLILYGLTFFFANYGPNSITFLLPSLTYSKGCRSTLNGMSAAAGKLGAFFGTSVFEPAVEQWGESTVMVICGCVSLVGLMLTKYCVGGNNQV